MHSIRFRFSLLAGACLFALTALGCGGNQQASGKSTKVASEGKLVCERYLPTGSHLTRVRCIRKSDVKDRRDADQETIREIQFGSNVNPDPQGN